MKGLITILMTLSLSLTLKATQDSLNTHVQIDTLEVYTSDSCLALLTVFNNGAVSEKRNAILTWYKTNTSKEYRKEKGIKEKYGVNLELVNHGERIEYLEDGQQRVSSYNIGYLVDSKLIDSNESELTEALDYGLQDDGSIKFYCSKDILYVFIIVEYGFPKRIRNKRDSRY